MAWNTRYLTQAIDCLLEPQELPSGDTSEPLRTGRLIGWVVGWVAVDPGRSLIAFLGLWGTSLSFAISCVIITVTIIIYHYCVLLSIIIMNH